MQKLGQNGYTDQEVEDELRFKRGRNQMGFRYELLDDSNRLIRKLTNILECSVKQDYGQDIKRTATISMLDDPTVNYLSNRIKPWVRLYMPSDTRPYSQIVNQYAAGLIASYGFDETSGVDATNSVCKNLIKNSTIDVDTSHWSAGTNATISRSTAQAYKGLASLAITSVAAGNAEAGSTADTASEWAVVPGTSYTVQTRFRAATTGRSIQLLIEWRDASQAVLLLDAGTVQGPDTTTGFTLSSATKVAPANAVYARLVCRVVGTGAAGEVHYADAFMAAASATVGPFVDSYAGTVGASVVKNQAGIASGSSYGFTGGTAAANVVQVPSAPDFFSGNAFSISVWIKSTVDLVSSTVMNLNPGAGNTISITFDASGNIVFAFKAADGTTNTTTSPNPYGRDLRHIFVTWQIGNYPSIYLNGAVSNRQTNSGSILSYPAIGVGNLQIGGGFTGAIDSLLFMSVPLTADRVVELYRSGARTGPFGSVNYAEWPQGVFLLSSPSRSLDPASVVTRGIECFDQLEVLTEDLAQARFVAQKAALYLNCVLGLALSYTVSRIPSYTTAWSKTNATSVSRAIGTAGRTDIVTITGPTSAGANGLYTPFIYTIANLDFQIEWPSIVWGTSGTRTSRMRFFIDANNYAEMVVKPHSSANTSSDLVINLVQNGSVVGTTTANFVTIPKYLRITEYNGYVIFQTGTGTITTTWTTVQTSAALPYLSAGRMQVEAVNTAADAAWTAFPNIYANAALWKNINATPSSAFLPVSKEYEPGTSKLSIINDLLSAINYEPAFYDENGNLVLKPYMSPAILPEEFVYADDQEGVTLPGNMAQTIDLFKTPNTWVGTATSVDGTSFSNMPNFPKINSNASSPTSTVNRGRTITKVMTNISETPDLATLLAYIDKVAEQDSQVYETVSFQTAIIPIHGERNILRIISSPLGLNDKYEEQSWSFDLKEGATMSHEVRKFVDIS